MTNTEALTYPSGQGWAEMPEGWKIERVQFRNDKDIGSFDGYWVSDLHAEPILAVHIDDSPAEPTVGRHRAAINLEGIAVNQWPWTPAEFAFIADAVVWCQAQLMEHRPVELVREYGGKWQQVDLDNPTRFIVVNDDGSLVQACSCGGKRRGTAIDSTRHYLPNGRRCDVQETT